MAGIQLTGLSSGLDWKTLVDQLMELNKAPIKRLETEQSKVGLQTTVLTSLKSKLEALKESVGTLNSSTAYNQRTATASNAQWTVAATTAATPTTHTIAVTRLATASRAQSSATISRALRSDGNASQVLLSAANVSPPITPGQFTVNGAKVTITATDTLADAFSKISAATGGAVTGTYSGSTDRVTLTSGSAIVLGSANDSSNFLTSMKLANNGTGSVSSTTKVATPKLDSPLASAGLATALALDGSNAGTLLVNGESIAFDADTDSLRTVMARINASAAGVLASYDATSDRMVLTNKVTGDLGVSVRDGVGNLAAALRLNTATLTRGVTSSFTVNGGTARTSNSNTLDEAALGVTGLSVTVASVTTERVTVASDTKAARTKIEDFVAKYNEVLAYVDQQSKVTSSGGKVTTGLIYGNNAVRDLTASMRSEVFKALGGTSGVQRLDALGIDFNGTTNQLKIKDSSKLDAALLSKTDDVASFFTTTSTGFANRIDALVARQFGTDGPITQAINAKTQRSSKITTQISDIQRRLDQQRSSLEAQFIQMERMQSLLQSQLSTLKNAFSSKDSDN